MLETSAVSLKKKGGTEHNMNTIERAREVLRAKYGKWFVNTVWGHRE
jgi:hypothetical protein